MAKAQTQKFDCTEENGNRGQVFTLLQTLLMQRKQFRVELVTGDDGSFRLTIEGTGRSVGDAAPDKDVSDPVPSGDTVRESRPRAKTPS
jgi:hypothetical protein